MVIGDAANQSVADVAITIRSSGQLTAPNTLFHISLSHSRSMIAVGISHQPIGIDIECMDRSHDFLSLARRQFTANEYQDLHALTGDQRRHRFYELWTQKEAALKAFGLGVSHMSAIGSIKGDSKLVNDNYMLSIYDHGPLIITI